MNFFHYKNNELMAESVPLKQIAAEVGTPCYVYSKATLEAQIQSYRKAFEDIDHIICFAVKNCSNLNLLRLIFNEGLGADIVSGGELFRSLRAGCDPQKIVFSGVGKSREEIMQALEANVLMFNVESEEELESLAAIAEEKRVKARVTFRINPDVDPKTHKYVATGLSESKFGISHDKAMAVYRKAAADPRLEVVGISAHIGSQLTQASPFAEAADKLKKIVLALRSEGISLKYFDLGGGLGIPYKENDEVASIGEYAESIKNAVKDLGLTLILEPGRYISGESAILLGKVLYNKSNGTKKFVITDCGMNDLIRPSLYGAWHEIQPVLKNGQEPVTVDVVGPVCESGDFLAQNRPLQPLKAGDLLVARNAGAYSFVMSSNYNSRCRAPEVLVDGDSYKIIKSRESYEDLIRGEE